MKRINARLLCTFLFFSVTHLSAMLEGDTPGIGKQVSNNEETAYEFNEFMPGLLPAQAMITFFERADLGIEGKLENIVDSGFSVGFNFVVRCYAKIKGWFRQE